jgi:hypothetical protein
MIRKPSESKSDQPPTLWQRWRRKIVGNMAIIGLAFGAVWYLQPPATIRDAPPLQAVTESLYRLTTDYQTSEVVDGQRVTLLIRNGFRFDGASIPRMAQSALGLSPFSPVLCRGALGHDALYAAHLTTRAMADKWLRAAILADGCERHKAAEIIKCVEVYGDGPWQRTDADVLAAREMVTVTVSRSQ